ncbi:U4/U6.U5 tri-snRNP-associated protein 1-like isoform X2 [Saccostrea echinata]|uniref:U4/U6.U5 tri-snRNP-associated protein 1-like isoform X2 n=1 Tax=Saccostrea echinata TaxID=191078 RepID=UPI002A7FDBCD|nr:U4/U6.U5 tri-snRNP-associated protein 1-like isoform X2 [Saccostrea echinata]
MGSSKKHKEKDRDREHKKKRKHRSRSRSKERKRHRHERDREHSDRERYRREEEYLENDDYYPKELEDVDIKASSKGSYTEAPAPTGGASGDVSLSIEETNRIRAKLGLKPLDVGPEKKQTDDGFLITKEGDVHKPALSLTEKKETEKLKERIQKMKDKRKIKDQLGKVKTLGESDSDDDTTAWVKKSRQKQKEKELAEKRAKQLMELDEAFGLEDIVKEEFKDSKKEYTSKDLRGLKVEHSVDRFKDGQSIILTLQDKGVLDEDEGDTLVNVNLVDDEKAEKNVELKKKKPDYNPYDTGDVDEFGMFKVKNVLDKYDEEIEGVKREKFELGSGGKYDTDPEKQMDEIRRQLREQSQSLGGVTLNPINEYLTPQEAAEAAKFKKVKKKVRKIRKKESLKADDLLPLPNQGQEGTDYGSRKRGRGYVRGEEDAVEGQSGYENGYGMTAPIVIDYAHGHTAVSVNEQPMEVTEEEEDLDGPDEDLSNVVIEEDEAEKELHTALSKARKIKQRKDASVVVKVAEQVLLNVKPEPEEEEAPHEGNIILNATSEFCRTLGDIPTYGQSGNREEDQEDFMDFEKELEERRKKEEDEEQMSGWNAVEIDETPVNITGEEQAVLEEEPVVSSGVGAALELAVKKGYIEDEGKKMAIVRSKAKLELEVQNYSIEDKRYDDLDEKYSRKRDRYSGGGGLIQDFKEKDGYKPDVKLEYVDDGGHLLNQKEAFRQLSHRFHGKGSGKKKTEKRTKKLQEEQLMKQMSSTDTPLGTLNMLKDKQRTEKSPYIVLSGSKGFSSNSIIKPSQT